MATCTHAVGTADTGLTPNTSGAFTPALNDLLIVFVAAGSTLENPGVITSSVGTTFSMFQLAVRGGTTHSLYGFVAESFSTAVSQTIAFAPVDVSTGTVIFACGVAGMLRTGLSAIRQTAKQNNVGAGGTPAPAFLIAALTGNVTLGCVANADAAGVMTEPAGWTEGGDLNHATPDQTCEYAFRNSGFTGTTITWGSAAGSNFGSMIVELDTSDYSLGAPSARAYAQPMIRGPM